MGEKSFSKIITCALLQNLMLKMALISDSEWGFEKNIEKGLCK